MMVALCMEVFAHGDTPQPQRDFRAAVDYAGVILHVFKLVGSWPDTRGLIGELDARSSVQLSTLLMTAAPRGDVVQKRA
jgi:hypothetical protein